MIFLLDIAINFRVKDNKKPVLKTWKIINNNQNFKIKKILLLVIIQSKKYSIPLLQLVLLLLNSLY